MKIKAMFLVLMSLVCAISLNAQKVSKKITITGTVLDASKKPITNAIIMIDGNRTSSLTDLNGKYKITVKRDVKTIGIFTFGSGMIEQEIGGRDKIDFSFGTSSANQPKDQEVKPGDEVVSTSYTNVRQKGVINEASSVDVKNKKYSSFSSVYDMIKSKDAGIRISGENIIIHNSKDFFGEVPALLVVDGVYVTSLSNIQPASVESISILKGTSAAIYGSRAYGGAIVIKTKIKND
jgi:TonB-dependent SusC/RagA subfamily outer membrane receptor